MIVDTLEHSDLYESLHDGFKEAFEFLRKPNLPGLEPGQHEIDGQRIFAMVARESGRHKEESELEAHRKYIDIQFIISGTDTMGWRSTADCQHISEPYDGEKDVIFFSDQPASWIACHPGIYAIFFPSDAHLPLISDSEIHKVVVKISI